jgi:ABC-type transport system involved in cytochrome bd biosynthesis fused ATPase/permease subunit
MEGAEEMSTTIEPTMRVETRRQPLPPRERLEGIFNIEGLDAIYSGKPAVKNVTMEVYKNLVTAIIGPSGCGKSTFIRCFNRMNDLIPGFTQTGTISYHGQDICGSNIDPVAVRRNIGMVFQRPNPFPKSIRDNVAWGMNVLGIKDNQDERIERALTQAALWDEVRDRLKASALSLSGRRAHGRARVRARPDRDAGDRGADAQPQERVHVRDRHAQHAAGRARRRHDRVLLHLARQRGTPVRRADRIRRDREDLHGAVR